MKAFNAYIIGNRVISMRKPRMCKKANVRYAMAIGVSIVKEIEKKSFQNSSFDLHLPFGNFNCIIVRDPTSDNIRKKKGSHD